MTKEIMEVRDAYMSCGECQKAVRKTKGKASLLPIPIM